MRGELDGYSFHGRTDPAIIVDLATRWGAPEALARKRLGECLEHYVAVLRDQITADDVEVLPGVRELVTALAVDRRVVLGVLTGNVDGGLTLKLAPTGLLPLFKVFASGSDSGLRPALPAIAVERARRLTGHDYKGREIVIIGDTPADIECGAELLVRTIAVATGRHTVAELAPCESRLPVRRSRRLAGGHGGDPRLNGRAVPLQEGRPARRRVGCRAVGCSLAALRSTGD